MYRHHKVNRMMSQARRIVRELFGLFRRQAGLAENGASALFGALQ